MSEGLLGQLYTLLTRKNKSIKHEVLNDLAKFVSDNNDLIELIINHPEFVPKLLHIIRCELKDLSKGALWVINKMLLSGNKNQLENLYRLQVFQIVCECLEDPDVRILMMALDCLHVYLELGA
jgi:hypothetical protein